MDDALEFDIVVVGAGTAGMPAAIEAADLGASVLVVEKTDRVGGVLPTTGGGISGANTKRQIAQGIEDSTEAHYRDVMRIGKFRNDSELVRLSVEHAAVTIDWLEEIGAEPRPLKSDGVWGKGKMVGGALHEPYSAQRLHFWKDDGVTLTRALQGALTRREERGDVTLLLKARMTRILREDDGPVTGIELEDVSASTTVVHAGAVIVATGGYGGNPELMAELHPTCVPALSMGGEFATGDGLTLSREVGAAIVNADIFVSYPGVLEDPVNPGWPAAQQLFVPPTESAAIWVNARGERFMDEDEISTDVREHRLIEQPGAAWYVVWDERIWRERPPDVNPWSREDFEREIERGVMVHRADTLEELAALAGIDPAGLVAGVARYNDGVARGEDEFGRGNPLPVVEPPFYAFKALGNVLSTKAGVKVNALLEAQREDGRAIPGLYVVGEAMGSGQIMGDGVSSGMNIGPAMTLGRLAARNAVRTARIRASARSGA